MTRVKLQHLTRWFGSTVALKDLSLEVESGEMVALLGPSGAGKTTTLRMIAGLLEPTSGDVLFDEVSMLAVPAEKRGAVMVFQSQLLFPTMTAAGNVGFGLRMRKVSKAEIDRRVAEMLDLVQLQGLGDRRAHELSDGQKQRVALARALIVRPRVLLLDEPLSNLDANLRIEMRQLIRSIQAETGITSIFVTHDQEEAVMLADRVALILSGALQQFGEPSEFYQRPRSPRVARFFRNTNVLRGVLVGSKVETEGGDLAIAPDRVGPVEGPVALTVRPEDVAISTEPDDPVNTMRAEVRANVYMGTDRHIVVSLCGSEWHLRTTTDASYAVGEVINVRLPPDKIWIFPHEEAEP